MRQPSTGDPAWLDGKRTTVSELQVPFGDPAFLAGLGCGLWPDKQAITATWREDRAFAPQMANEAVEAHLARWQAAVGKA